MTRAEDLCEVVVTAPDEAWSVESTRSLVEQRLAAAGHHQPIRSVYTWRGAVHDRTETRIALHTRDTAQLADNPTGQDLASSSPLALAIRDFNRVEKIAKLPRPLTMEGVPAGDDPDINDIGYYAPSNDLVFYYGEVGYFNGIVRIGRISGQDIKLIERQQDGAQITIERA